MESKICTTCNISQELTNFYKRLSKCKKCRNEQINKAAEYRKQQPKPKIETKICSNCKTTKNVSEFNNSSISKDGFMSKCKLCCNEYNKSLVEKRKKTIVVPEKKICKECNVEKPASQFNALSARSDGKSQYCQDCVKIILKTKEQEFFSKPTVNQRTCKKCHVAKYLVEFRVNKKGDRYFKICKECWKPREWTKEKQAQSDRKYIQNNPEKLREKYRKENQNINRKLRSRMNGRIKNALKRELTTKDNHTFEYIGCSMNYLKKWFEYQFTDTINWDNMKEWHIDHVTPCDNFDLTDHNQQLTCFNWTNLRPCLIKENLAKNNKIIPELIDSQRKKAETFQLLNPLPTQPGNRVEGTD